MRRHERAAAQTFTLQVEPAGALTETLDLLGLGVGLGVEAAVIPGASGGEPHSAYVPMSGTIGAGIGSLVGLIVSAARR